MATFTFDEEVQNSGGLSITADGIAKALSAPVVSGATISYTVDQIYSGQSLLCAYTPGDITDLAANSLAAFSGQPITNNSAASNPTLFAENYDDASDDSGGTYACSTQATYFDANGDVQTAAINTPRFETVGGNTYLLLEPADTRINNADPSTWGSPGGTETAAYDSGNLCNLPSVEITGQTADWHRRRIWGPAAQTGLHTLHFLCAAGNQSALRLTISNTVGTPQAIICSITVGSDPSCNPNPSCGTLTFLGRSEPKTGEHLYSFSFSPAASGDPIDYGFGTGTVNPAHTIRIAAPQLSASSTPTSYVVGAGTNVARAGQLPGDAGGMQYTAADLETSTRTITYVDGAGLEQQSTDDSYIDYDAGTDVLKIGHASAISRIKSISAVISPGTIQTVNPALLSSAVRLRNHYMGHEQAAKLNLIGG